MNFILGIIKSVLPFGFINYLYKKCIPYRFTTKKIFKEYYKPLIKNTKSKYSLTSKNNKKMIIYMADGRRTAMGLADRLRGIASLYKLSKDFNIDFKINMTSPLNLTNFLLPNKYNWIINDDEIIYDIKYSIIYDINSQASNNTVYKNIEYMLKKYDQIHSTSNITLGDIEYGNLFNELFIPTEELNILINKYLNEIGEEFISTSFRFGDLLGDFHESNKPSLSPIEQNKLISRCIEHLIEINNINTIKKIVVLSDSITFINSVKHLDFVFIIPGEIAHLDHQLNLDKNVYMKIFLDYFILTHSKKIYLIIDGNMLQSGFPHRAALHNLPFIIKRY